jgi:hypothetical protein
VAIGQVDSMTGKIFSWVLTKGFISAAKLTGKQYDEFFKTGCYQIRF